MKLLKIITSYIVALLLITSNVNALVINLGQTIGSPANQTAEFNRLLEQVDLYNSATEPDLPAPDENAFSTIPTPSSPKSIDLDITDLSGYLLFKWGNVDQFYYVENETIKTFGSSILNNPGTAYLGLSHYNTWLITDINGDSVLEPLPEDGTMVAMLGLGMVGVIAYRRKMNMTA